MCGICGTVGFGSGELVHRMARMLTHRGPDDVGFYSHPEKGVHLGHMRLGIIDPECGSQPVFSEDGRIVAVANGEIYNFRELRSGLSERGHRFRSRSDAEIIPHLYEESGSCFVRRLDGMFAIALYDSSSGEFLLARDHAGIKPLYVWEKEGRFAFASEVKALLQVPEIDAQLNLQSLHSLLNIRFVPGTATLFSGIRKVPPASVLLWRNGSFRRKTYWKLPEEPEQRINSKEEYSEATRHLLARAVKKQMVSDVPVGLYLSGGLDSSALAATASEVASEPLNSFTLGFDEPTDELEDARLVAETFGTHHHESTLRLDPLTLFPRVVWHVEEPKENAIQLYALAGQASQHVKVALSGLGGDELFGGYQIYEYLNRLAPLQSIAGRRLNAKLLWPLRNILNVLWGQLGSMRFDLARRGFDFLMSAGVPERGYLILRNLWEHDRRLFQAIYSPEAQRQIENGLEAFFHSMFLSGRGGMVDQVLRAEFSLKMADDFLMNEDRGSMAHSMEVRVPFLDRDLVEFAFSIPAKVKFADRHPKPVLRKAMKDLLPEKTLLKPKWGFTFDSYYQFQKDLRHIAELELTEEFIRKQGIFNYGFIKEVLEHPPHRWMRWHYFLIWLILGVKVWEGLFIEGKPPEDCYEHYRPPRSR